MSSTATDDASFRALDPAAYEFACSQSELYKSLKADDAETSLAQCLPPDCEGAQAMSGLALLAALHAEGSTASTNALSVCSNDKKPALLLFPCLSEVSKELESTALQLSDYLGLPRVLSTRIRQHKALKLWEQELQRRRPVKPSMPADFEAFALSLTASSDEETEKEGAALTILIGEANEVLLSFEPLHFDGKRVITGHGQDTKLAFLRGGWGDDSFVVSEPTSDFDSRPHRFACAYLAGRIAGGKGFPDPMPSSLRSGLLCSGAPEADCPMCSWPAATAAVKGDADALALLRARHFPAFNYLAIRCAAEAGRVSILRSLSESSASAKAELTGYGGSIVLLAAAKKGRIEVLQWLIGELGFPRTTLEAKAEQIYAAAASENRVESLQALRTLGLPWPPSNQDGGRTAVEAAAQTGSIEALRWLLSQDPPAEMDETCIVTAAKAGQISSLEFLRHGVTMLLPAATTSAAFLGPVVAGAGVASMRPCPWDERAIILATMAGSFEAVDWLRRNGAPE